MNQQQVVWMSISCIINNNLNEWTTDSVSNNSSMVRTAGDVISVNRRSYQQVVSYQQPVPIKLLVHISQTTCWYEHQAVCQWAKQWAWWCSTSRCRSTSSRVYMIIRQCSYQLEVDQQVLIESYQCQSTLVAKLQQATFESTSGSMTMNRLAEDLQHAVSIRLSPVQWSVTSSIK